MIQNYWHNYISTRLALVFATQPYILCENQDTKVSELLDLGKKWHADSVEVTDGTNEEYSFKLQRRLRTRLEGSLLGNNVQHDCDAVMITYWWD